MSWSDVSVVVVTYCSLDVIGQCLDSLVRHMPTAEVIVVDNASTDGTADFIACEYPAVRVVRSELNTGFACGCNLGAYESNRRRLLFLNPDARISRAVPSSVRVSEPSPHGIVALAYEGADELRHWVFSTPRPRVERFGLIWAEFWPRWLPTAPWTPREGSAWISGAGLLVDREEFLALGGFAEEFFLLYEDRELSERYLAAKSVLRTTDTIVMEHDVGASSSGVGISVNRQCWAIMSWLEWRSTHVNDFLLVRDARAVVRSLCAQATLLSILDGHFGESRAVGKLRHASHVKECVEKIVLGEELPDYYPKSRSALKRILIEPR